MSELLRHFALRACAKKKVRKVDNEQLNKLLWIGLLLLGFGAGWTTKCIFGVCC